MKPSSLFPLCFVVGAACAQQPATQPTQLTIYNGDFAVARTTIALDLHAGVTEALTTEVTSKLEPDSVVLRDVAGHHAFRILEQDYDAGVVNQQWLLDKYEGKMLDFQVSGPFTAITDGGLVKMAPPQIVQARVVRAGQNPLVEFNGHLQFQLPGTPLFPADTQGLLLKPTLRWQIENARAEHVQAELDYITHGLSWQATYNVVVPEEGTAGGKEIADVLGWVTVQNDCGTDFPQATLQLMAGDVAKLPEARRMYSSMGTNQMVGVAAPAPPPVTQRAFDDFHLYDLHRTVSLREGESKQVQFLEAGGVAVNWTYEYTVNSGGGYLYAGAHNEDRAFGLLSNKTVNIREEIKNAENNHLGMPLPGGRLRLYRRETTGQMQFVGESEVQHTPAEQTVDISSGNAFDLTGETRQTAFHVDSRAHILDESFEVKLSNAKTQPVTIHAVAHLNRAQSAEITAKSQDFIRRDSATLDFPVVVPGKGSATLTYTVHYMW